MTIKEKVKQILEDYPQSRNSDTTLVVWLWWRFHTDKFKKDDNGDLWIKASDISKLEHHATIGRMRRKYQEKGLYLSDKQVAEERARKAKGVQHTINDNSFGERYLP